MQKFFQSLLNIVEAITPYVYVLVILAFLVIGGMFAIGGEEGRQKAKKWVPWVLVGGIIMLGCVSIGKDVVGQFAF